MAQNGKTARLPHGVREQLNRRLRDGEQGQRLVEWLNSLPEVKAVLAAEFGGEPVRKCNLSQYRKGGYQEWFCRQEALVEAGNLALDATGVQGVVFETLSDRFATWIASRYAVAAAKMDRSGADDSPTEGKAVPGAGKASSKVSRGAPVEVAGPVFAPYALRRSKQFADQTY